LAYRGLGFRKSRGQRVEKLDGETPEVAKRDVLLEWGGGLNISELQHFRVRDFGSLEDKEQGYFGVGNPEVLKEVCGHGGKWSHRLEIHLFDVSAFEGLRSQGTRHLGSRYHETRNPDLAKGTTILLIRRFGLMPSV